MKTTSILLTGALMMALSSAPQVVSAQNNSKKQPAWMTQEPKVKNTYYSIVSVPKHAITADVTETEEGQEPQPAIQTSSIIASQLFFNDKYKETARKEAQKKVLGSLHLAVDGNSLLADMIIKGVYTSSFDDVFIDRVLNIPEFKLQGEWEDDDVYWCYYSISEADYQKRMTTLEDSICNQAQTIWEVGLSCQQEGQLQSAASYFSNALDLIHPLIYSQHMIKHNFETVDLYTSIYQSYIHVYDDIELKTSVESIPAVAGEAVPYKFSVTVEQKGNPISKIGIIVDYEGDINGTLLTDKNGECSYEITKAGQEQNQTISFSIDKNKMFDLPEIYAFSQLTAKADKFGTAQIEVNLFDPTNYIYLNVNPLDSTLDKSLRDILEARKDLVVVTDKSKADLIMNASIKTIMAQESVAADKYAINQYESAMGLDVTPVDGGSKLFEYTIDEFQFMAPASRSKDQVLHSSAKEMSRQITREFAEKFQPFSYDKRDLVWSKLNN